jgi:N-acetylglucosaminyldiphosphoundecaprenol N-acetyl-beta-D-mannosaminyltransferase
MDSPERRLGDVIGTPIDIITWEQATARITAWTSASESRIVCICNVHSVVTARQDPELRRAIHSADMATPDGAPVAWLLRWLGAASQPRINGPDLMFNYCQEAAGRGESIYLYGGSDATNRLLAEHLPRRFPGLVIGGAHSPPFRPLTPAEDEAVCTAINCSGARTVWVGLGCPKQEKWMAAHRGRIQAVMIGVGAAFDYHAGTIPRAPLWMQHNGLEWLHRLASEPRRLWKRYLVSNTLFLWHALRQLMAHQSAKWPA